MDPTEMARRALSPKSVRLKVLVGVLVPLALVLGVFAYLQMAAHRDMVLSVVTGDGAWGTDTPLAAVDPHLDEYRRYTLLSLGGALLIGGLMLGFVLDRLVIAPLDELTATARAVAGGDLARRARVKGDDELGELAGAVNLLGESVAAQSRLEAQLRQHTAELEGLYDAVREKEAVRSELLKQVINAQEDERKRVARHLHDELAQSLTGLVMSLDAAEGALGDDFPDATRQLVRTRSIVTESLDQTRQLILDLRPGMLDDLGLVPAIRWYADTHLGRAGAVVVVSTEGTRRRLSPERETTVFRVAQEAMNNVARHAEPDHVWVRLLWAPSSVTLVVEDDGRGFDTGHAFEISPTGAGIGLLGMRERVAMMGGQIEITSEPGTGTRIEVRVPTAKGAKPDADPDPDR